MENKQTAVDFLIERLRVVNKRVWAELYEECNQAKQIEKEQIINAFGEKRQFIGFENNEFFGIKEVTGEEFYNKTYGKGN